MHPNPPIPQPAHHAVFRFLLFADCMPAEIVYSTGADQYHRPDVVTTDKYAAYSDMRHDAAQTPTRGHYDAATNVASAMSNLVTHSAWTAAAFDGSGLVEYYFFPAGYRDTYVQRCWWTRHSPCRKQLCSPVD
jgi:hypothetical protein